jgi:hypothetical protein
MNDLSAFRQAAAAMRSRTGFDGTFFTLNGESGHYAGGKDKTIMDGRKVLADVFNLCVGQQKFADGKPIYIDVGFVRDRHMPRPREQLGDLDKSRWRNGVDPWQLAYYPPAYEEETRQRYIFTTSSTGGKDALATLQEAFADHNETLAAAQCPVVELLSDSYVNNFGKRIYFPIFGIVGWVDQPSFFRAVTPPPSAALIVKPPLALEANGSDFGGAETDRRSGDMNDEIPF